MKNILTVAFIAISVLVYSQVPPTTLEENGVNGKVKTIKIDYYNSDGSLSTSELETYDTAGVLKEKTYYDDKNNQTRREEYVKAGKTLKEVLVYDYKNEYKYKNEYFYRENGTLEEVRTTTPNSTSYTSVIYKENYDPSKDKYEGELPELEGRREPEKRDIKEKKDRKNNVVEKKEFIKGELISTVKKNIQYY